MKKIILLLAAVAALFGCKSNKGETQTTKSLIIYYSQTGATKSMAEELQKQTGADMELIEAVKPYDGDFVQTIQRCQEEMAAGATPDIKPLKANIEDYDTIYIGYPVWFGTYALPVATLLKTVNLDDKVIVPFCTFGSGGVTETVAALREAFPNSTLLDGFGIRNARIGKLVPELSQYLINVGIKPGTALTLPDFSEQKEVTEAEKTIFDAACGDYPMPLGTPVSVGSRKIQNGTEYLFTTSNDDGKGHVSQARIHVTSSDSAGVKPEFTLVER